MSFKKINLILNNINNLDFYYLKIKLFIKKMINIKEVKCFFTHN